MEDSTEESLSYLSGFNNQHSSEAVPGALPVGQNSPQQPPFGLYAEQLSGSAFTAPRATNARTWLYRIAPSVTRGKPTPTPAAPARAGPLLAQFDNTYESGTDGQKAEEAVSPSPLRWSPLPLPMSPVDWVDSLVTLA
eukprot:6160206-Pleurochrysis_carterae.AAC.2